METVDTGSADDPGVPLPKDTQGPPADAIQQSGEVFFDAASLPDELKGQWKKMQASYTRKMQDIKGARDALDLVNRFNSDPEFAAQVLQQRAAQLGLSLNRMGTSSGAQTSTFPAQHGEPPAEFVAAMQAQFPPELAWMAPMQAKAWWAANQQAMAPIMERLREQETSRSEDEWQRVESDMDEKYPTWRDDEDLLAEMATFLRGNALRHPRFGNKLELIWKALKGEAFGVAEATRRMSAAGRNRVSTGSNGRQMVDNVKDRVMQAKTATEAFRLAAEAAAQELKGQ